MNEDVKDHYLNYLRETHLELRDEIKKRVKQRTDYYIQYLLALAALFGIQIYDVPIVRYAILIIPAITIYYAYLTLKSALIHIRIVDFLRFNIETRLHKEFNLPKEDLVNLFWENYSGQERTKINEKAYDGETTIFEILSILFPFISGFLFYWTWRADVNAPSYISLITIISILSFSILAFFVIVWNDLRCSKIKNFIKRFLPSKKDK